MKAAKLFALMIAVALGFALSANPSFADDGPFGPDGPFGSRGKWVQEDGEVEGSCHGSATNYKAKAKGRAEENLKNFKKDYDLVDGTREDSKGWNKVGNSWVHTITFKYWKEYP